MTGETEELVKRLMDGDRRALARAITLIEDDATEASKIIREVYPKTGDAKIVGITGAPGVGKSTIIDRTTNHLIEEGLEVGIIAIDPSSPFTGGALLGDRVRMSSRGSEGGAFFRSMGSRGALGGLSQATSDVAKLMDSSGMDFIFIETVGVGHGEVEVAKIADTCVVVLMPGTGDEIQAMKAGILEIGDIFVINKADMEGSEQTARQIRTMIEMRKDRSEGEERWKPPVLILTAKDDEGVEEFISEIWKHVDYLEESGELERVRKNRMKEELIDLVKDRLTRMITKQVESDERLEELARKVSIEKRIDPRTAAEELISKLEL